MKLRIRECSGILLFELFCLMPYDLFKYITSVNIIRQLMIPVLLFLELLYVVSPRDNSEYHIGGTGIGIMLFAGLECGLAFRFNTMSNSSLVVYYLSILLLITIIAKVDNEESLLRTVNTLAAYSFVGIVLNCISVFIFRDGFFKSVASSGNIHNVYFLGFDNQFGRFVFPGLSFISFADQYELQNGGFHFRTFIAIILVIVAYIITNSATGLVISLLFLMMLILVFRDSNIINRILSIRTALLVAIVLTALLVSGRYMVYTNNAIAQFIFRHTGKESNFSGRTYIWIKGLESFAKNPVFGIGKTASGAVVNLNGIEFSAHNLILQILIECGILGFFILSISVLWAGRYADKVIVNQPEIRLLVSGLFITLLFFCFEYGSIIEMLFLIYLIYKYSYYCSSYR